MAFNDIVEPVHPLAQRMKSESYQHIGIGNPTFLRDQLIPRGMHASPREMCNQHMSFFWHVVLHINEYDNDERAKRAWLKLTAGKFTVL
jgi:hypothetical protein